MKTKFILSLAISLILFISCEKEIIIEKEVEKQYSWKLDENFQFEEKVQFNSFADSSHLYTIGINNFSIITTNKNDPSILDIKHPMLYFNYPIDHKMPITSDLFIGVGSSYIVFHPSKNPLQGYFNINMKDIDNTFYRFEMPRLFTSNAIALNDEMQCLVVYSYLDSINPIYTMPPVMKLLLIDLKKWGMYSQMLDTISTHIIPFDVKYERLISLHTFDNDFFITTTEKTYKLSTDNELKTVLPTRLIKLIKKDNILYGFSDSEIFSSSDNGDSWQLLLENAPWYFPTINYALINNEIIGYRYAQLFHIDFHSNEINIVELQNDGLEGNRITSVSHFLEKIYVTTLSGVYTREFEDFFSYQTE